MLDSFHKTLPKNTFYVLLVKIWYLEKKQVISTPVCLRSGGEGVLINGNRGDGLQFFLRIGTTHGFSNLFLTLLLLVPK